MTKITFGAKTPIVPQTSHATQLWAEDVNELRTAVNENDTTELSTSSTVVFDKLSGYTHGTWALPITGDITLDLTGAQEGAVVVVIWRGATNPTFLGGTVQSLAGVISSDGVYSIYIHHLDGRVNANIFNVSSPGALPQFEIVTSATNLLIFDSLDEISLLHTEAWAITILHTNDELLTEADIIIMSGETANFTQFRRFADGHLRCNLSGVEGRWTDAGAISTHDNINHKYELVHSVGVGVNLWIDDVDYGLADIGTVNPTNTIAVQRLCSSTGVKDDGSVRRLEIDKNGTIDIWAMSEGTGVVTTSNNGNIIDLTDASMWNSI